MRIPSPFIVCQHGRFLFVIFAYSRAQAHDLVAARLADTAGIRIIAGFAAMIPDTHHGLPAMACVSALQKCIRRGLEREAMEFAVELIGTSKSFHTMVCKRLEIISHEDIDTISQPWIVPFVAAAVAQAQRWYDPDKLGASRMAVGNAIRLMCRSMKSREGDHFAIAVGLANEIGGKVPVIPDWALDGHTIEGKRMGRGLAYFREHSAQLVPPVKPDLYEAEAYAMLALKQGKRDLFDAE